MCHKKWIGHLYIDTPDRSVWRLGGRQQASTILSELGTALDRANVRVRSTKTGAGRSVSLRNFFPRSVNSGNYKTGAGKRIWVPFSKSKPERLRGAHASWVCRILSELQIDLAHLALDAEYGTASTWLGASKITGLEKLDHQEGIYIDDRNSGKILHQHVRNGQKAGHIDSGSKKLFADRMKDHNCNKFWLVPGTLEGRLCSSCQPL